MADYAKDSEKQTALRRQIENHPIWQYPPEERLRITASGKACIYLCLSLKNFAEAGKSVEQRRV